MTDEATADQNQARALHAVSLGLAVTATAALGVGVILWVSDAQSEGPGPGVPSTSRPNVSLEARPGGATLDMRFYHLCAGDGWGPAGHRISPAGQVSELMPRGAAPNPPG